MATAAEFKMKTTGPIFTQNMGGLQPRVLNALSRYQLRETRQRFRQEKDPDGKPWPARSSLRSSSVRLLYGKGDLFRSIVAVVEKTRVVIGSVLVYAGIHQEGRVIRTSVKQSVWMWANLFDKKGSPFRFKKITIPRRRFLGFSKKDRKQLVVIARHVMKEFLT